MKKLATLTLSMFLVSGTAFADTPKNADSQPAKAQPAKPKAAKKADKSDAAISAQLEELRQTLQSQQEQLQLLKEELAKRDRQIDEAREAAAAANARANEASTKAIEAVNSTAGVKSTAVALNSTVSDLKASNESLKTTVATEQAEAKKSSEESATTIHYKGISISPGGFIAAETVFRNRSAQSDVNTQAFNGIPFYGNPLAHTTEFQASGRQTRVTLLAEGSIGRAKITGYEEADFLTSSVNSNNRESNSYGLRQRQLWAQAALDNGLTFTAGQMWSLVTETRKGLQNRTEALPMTIDAQYTAGFSWARQYGFRVVKNFGDKLALGFSVEGPQVSLGGRGFTTVNGNINFFLNAPGASGGLFNAFDATGYTVNQRPDFVIKAAADPGWGHYEVFYVLRTFRDRVYPCLTATVAAPCPANGATAPSTAGAFNDSRLGGGLGFNARVPLFNKKLDAGVHFLGGDGVGRYGTSQLSDVTARPNGTLAPIRGGQALGTLEWHASPKLDVYANVGMEYAFRTTYLNAAGTGGVGYGSRLFNNSGCNTEANFPTNQNTPGASGTCNGDVKDVIEGTIGFWHKIYQGPKGRLQWGLQYSYVLKNTWSGTGGLATGAAGPGFAPSAGDNMVFSSFRYYLP
jgi:hypothetical protein